MLQVTVCTINLRDFDGKIYVTIDETNLEFENESTLVEGEAGKQTVCGNKGPDYFYKNH